MKMKSGLSLSALAALVFTLVACGAAQLDKPSDNSSTQSSDGSDGTKKPAAKPAEDGIAFDEAMTPPKEYYDALFTEAVRNADKGFALVDAAQVLWLNFDGANVPKGYGKNQSFIPCKAVATIPPSGLSPADRDQIVALVQKSYEDAGARIIVTPAKPTSGDFTTMQVGGAYKDLGCIGGASILGVAPLDQGNANRNDIGFAFIPSYASARLIAETIAHEAGHSFGLDHVTTSTDIMYASAGANMIGFGIAKTRTGKVQDEPAILKQVLGVSTGGTVVVPPSSPTTPAIPTPAAPTTPVGPIASIPGLPNLPIDLANLPGLGQLGNIGQLIPGLGAGNALDISKLLPQLQALLPAAGGLGGFPGLDQVLTIIGLASQAGGGQAGIPGANLPIDPALASLILGSTTGAPLNISSLLALIPGGVAGQPANAGGFGGIIGGILGGLGGLGGSTPTPAIPALSTLPDLTQLLGLSNGAVPDLSTLISSFTGSAKVVNGNFGGANKDALLSLLKVAYAQQFQQLAALPAP